MTTTPPRYGVDLSSVRRQALYATPKRSPGPGASSVTGSGAAGYSRASYFGSATRPREYTRTPGSAASTAFADSRRARGSDAAAHVVNSGRKRSRGSVSLGQSGSQHTASASKAPGFGYGHRGDAVKTKPSTPVSNRAARALWTVDGGDSRGRGRDREQESERGYASPGTVSPPPLANSRWHLAGGHDSPTAAQANAYEQGALYLAGGTAETTFKRLADDGVGSYSYNFTAGLEGPGAEIAGPLGMREGNGRSSAHSSNYYDSSRQQYGSGPEDGGSPSWGMGKALLGAAAGVAGFVFHFCTAGAFRGFQAGGGQRWTAGAGDGDIAMPIPGDYNASQWHDNHGGDSDSAHGHASNTGTTTPSPKRAAKKMKSSHDDDGALQNSWIMVGPDGTGTPELSSSTTMSRTALTPIYPTKSTASPAALRQRAKPGTHKRRFTASVTIPAHTPDSLRPASSAALRSPSLRQSNAGAAASDSRPGSRPGSAARRRTTMMMNNNNPSAPGVDHMSVGMDPGPDGMYDDVATESPLGREGEKLVRQQRRRAREEDREIASMNRRLEEMIRQGREALGTRFEVEELDECEMQA